MTVKLTEAVAKDQKVTVANGKTELAVIAAGETTATYTVEVKANTDLTGVTVTEASAN